MSDRYCVYNGKKYKIKKKNDKYIITSRVRKEDFINYIDVLGNEHSELFSEKRQIFENYRIIWYILLHKSRLPVHGDIYK